MAQLLHFSRDIDPFSSFVDVKSAFLCGFESHDPNNCDPALHYLKCEVIVNFYINSLRNYYHSATQIFKLDYRIKVSFG